MLSIGRRDPVMPSPAARPSCGAPPAEGQGAKNAQKQVTPREHVANKQDDFHPSTSGPSPDPQRQQALAKDRQYLSHLSDAYQQMPPEKIEGYGLEDPVKAQVDAEAQAFKDILENIVPEA